MNILKYNFMKYYRLPLTANKVPAFSNMRPIKMKRSCPVVKKMWEVKITIFRFNENIHLETFKYFCENLERSIMPILKPDSKVQAQTQSWVNSKKGLSNFGQSAFWRVWVGVIGLVDIVAPKPLSSGRSQVRNTNLNPHAWQLYCCQARG